MAKLWCPICTFYTCKSGNANQGIQATQQDINAHLLSTHNHTVTDRNESWYRRIQNRRWEARAEALDLQLRENTRNKRIEWEAFAANPRIKDVPSTTGIEEELLREMVGLNEIEDDSDIDGDECSNGGQLCTAELVGKENSEPKTVIERLNRSSPNEKETASKHISARAPIDVFERESLRQRRREKRRAVRKDLAAFKKFESGER